VSDAAADSRLAIDARGGSDAASSPDGSGGSGLPTLGGFLAGTNLSGAEFAPGTLPGTFGSTYTYPTHAEVDYFTGKGFRIFRIPFLWERMQPTLEGPLDSTQLGYLTDIVSYATSKGAYAVVDPHNYARYDGLVIGSTSDGGPPAASAADYGDFWAKLAATFASNPHVVFGLMNEPNTMPTELWLADANAAIAAIRQGGARNVIFVPGNAWTGAYSWDASWYGTPNATVMLGVVDPIDNYVFELHQYLDPDSSGTSSTCASTTVGSQSLMDVTTWLSTHHVRGFLGEFGAAFNPTCMSAVDDMLTFIDQNRDVWAGWTWWSAGPWWGSYPYSIEPTNGQDAPQLATLLPHI
jgi:endoglucanase